MCWRNSFERSELIIIIETKCDIGDYVYQAGKFQERTGYPFNNGTIRWKVKEYICVGFKITQQGLFVIAVSTVKVTNTIEKLLTTNNLFYGKELAKNSLQNQKNGKEEVRWYYE